MTALDGVPESPGRIDEGASTMTDATRVPQHTSDIRAQDGTLEALHVRKDPPLGRKHVSWPLPNGTKGLGGRPVKTLPLYRSEDPARPETGDAGLRVRRGEGDRRRRGDGV